MMGAMACSVPDLPYPYDTLEPHISAEPCASTTTSTTTAKALWIILTGRSMVEPQG